MCNKTLDDEVKTQIYRGVRDGYSNDSSAYARCTYEYTCNCLSNTSFQTMTKNMISIAYLKEYPYDDNCERNRPSNENQ